MQTALVWFRQDLRLEDNPALNRALVNGYAVVPVYLWSPGEAGDWAPGGAAKWWLHHALADFQEQLKEEGLDLVLRKGDALAEIPKLAEECGAAAVYWNRCYEPWRMRIDSRLKSELKEAGLEAWSGNASLLREPWEVATQAGKPYKVFSPFARRCQPMPDAPPEDPAGRLRAPEKMPAGQELEELGLLPKIRWDAGLAAAWEPTRKAGQQRLRQFLRHRVKQYDQGRNLPAVDGTSRLSPYLHWGQLGPREVAAAVRESGSSKGVRSFYNEIIWREFAYHVLYHFPTTPESPLQPKFRDFPWEEDDVLLKAWQQGRTGYPLVDAGMRQLYETGWMHNRVRMLVGSFLVKHLLQPWQAGERWFWDCLVDADLASNTLGWQWAGGCGADAAPYFRIFNPITQSEKFDGGGEYIRRFVPELESVPDSHLHKPWTLPPQLQEACGCRIGKEYPEPVIAHEDGRARALAAFEKIKEVS